MSLFQCEHCGCVENTALSSQGFNLWPHLFDWSYAPERKGMKLCSVCGPVKYSDSTSTGYGKWHNRFPQTFLPKGEFVTSGDGNLQHKATGDKDYMKYQISRD